MDGFAFAADGTESGPGTPDDANSGNGIEVLDIANQQSGTWTIESHVGITPAPTAAHAVATFTYATIPIVTPPTLAPDARGFIDASPLTNYQSADVLER